MSDLIDFEALKAPFPAFEIEWRVGQKSKGKPWATLLAYINARAVMDRLDKVVGVSRWSTKYTPVELRVEDPKAGIKVHSGFVCELSIEVEPGVWVTKSDVSDLTDIESLKGGVSGALKRAAVQFGIGRYLYGLEAQWHKVLDGWPPEGSGAISCNIGDTPGHIPVPTLPDWALPATEHKVRKKETEAEKEERKSKHDPSWEADRSRFAAMLKELGTEIDQVSGFCEKVGRPRPSAMTQEARDRLLAFLRSTKGAELFSQYVSGAV